MQTTRLFIGHNRIDFGHIAGTAAGEQEDCFEAIKGPNGGEQRRHGDDIAQTRQGNTDKALPGVGTIDLRSFIEFSINRLQSRQHIDSEEGNTSPDVDRNYADHGQLWVSQPGERLGDHAQALQDRIQPTKERV